MGMILLPPFAAASLPITSRDGWAGRPDQVTVFRSAS
jgi:hypothetical protein